MLQRFANFESAIRIFDEVVVGASSIAADADDGYGRAKDADDLRHIAEVGLERYI
jgi:hypothetical protein